MNFKESLAMALVSSVIAFSIGTAYMALAVPTDTLTVTVLQTMSFTTSSSNFPSITPGSVVFATTTLDVATNDANGYFITLSGDNKSTGNNNLQLAANAASIPDQTEWINPAAGTTTPGNAVQVSSLTNTQNVLAFRVMTASGTADLRIPTWWGTVDSYLPSNANTLWAGIASSTVARKIVSTTVGSYSSSHHFGSVNYYLSVAATQQTGAYSAPLTYSATGI